MSKRTSFEDKISLLISAIAIINKSGPNVVPCATQLIAGGRYNNKEISQNVYCLIKLMRNKRNIKFKNMDTERLYFMKLYEAMPCSTFQMPKIKT